MARCLFVLVKSRAKSEGRERRLGDEGLTGCDAGAGAGAGGEGCGSREMDDE